MASCKTTCGALRTSIDYNLVPSEVKEVCRKFILDRGQLREIMDMFRSEIEKGLKADTHPKAIVKCFVTYVQDLPTGKETGKFLALDLGGTNFRVLCIELVNGECHMESKIYELPPEAIKSSGEVLFDKIAECLESFIQEYNIGDKPLPLGFTFSFPLRQEGLTAGVLERWTKGFSASGVENNDVVRFLEEAIEKRKIKIEVFAILNDTTGTLMSCAWKDHNTFIGLIVGTGSNACYVECVKNAEMFQGDKSKPVVIINCEWGAFGDDGALDCYRTEFDKEVDTTSLYPGKQLFEKMISGMYLGELVRLILVDLIKRKVFLKKANGQFGKFEEKDALETKIISKAETNSDDPQDKYINVREAFEMMDCPACRVTEEDYQIFRYVCDVVSTRSAELAAAGIMTLVEKMGRKQVTVGVDGSVYRLHPHYAKKMAARVKDLSAGRYSVKLMLSEDGSGRGAALVAAVAAHNQKDKKVAKQCKASCNVK